MNATIYIERIVIKLTIAKEPATKMLEFLSNVGFDPENDETDEDTVTGTISFVFYCDSFAEAESLLELGRLYNRRNKS